MSLNPELKPIGHLQDESSASHSSRSELKGRGITEAWPKLAEVKQMIPYLRTKLGLVYIEVLCFEASCFASDTAKVGKIWLIISRFLIVRLISSSGGIGILT